MAFWLEVLSIGLPLGPGKEAPGGSRRRKRVPRTHRSVAVGRGGPLAVWTDDVHDMALREDDLNSCGQGGFRRTDERQGTEISDLGGAEEPAPDEWIISAAGVILPTPGHSQSWPAHYSTFCQDLTWKLFFPYVKLIFFPPFLSCLLFSFFYI